MVETATEAMASSGMDGSNAGCGACRGQAPWERAAAGSSRETDAGGRGKSTVEPARLPQSLTLPLLTR